MASPPTRRAGCEAIRCGCVRCKIADWIDVAHNLTGSAETLGLNRVAATSAAIEYACKDNDQADAARIQKDLGGQLDEGWRLLAERYSARAKL